MNVLGVIAEFNPFHRGHHYLLSTAARECHADYTIVVMSGNFTQRGEPAIYDKFIRTRLALECGADLVLEMPVAAAAASAQDFARCGVALLSATGVVTHLSFGCENDDLPLLQDLAGLLAREPAAYKDSLKDGLKNGASWPAARSQALVSLLCGKDGAGRFMPPSGANNISEEILTAFLKQPNNILALEYLMALQSPQLPGSRQITPLPIRRVHAGYHDQSLEAPICSASALRHGILGGLPPENYLTKFPDLIQPQMRRLIAAKIPMEANDFSQALGYRLLTLPEGTLTTYLDVDEDLSRRIENQRNDFTGFEPFCDLLCTRTYTRTRLSRALMHILLGIEASHRAALIQTCYAPYLRILGFRRASAPLLSAIKAAAFSPIITRPALAMRQPQTLWPALQGQAAHRLFSLDVQASDIYRSVYSVKSGQAGVHEFQQKIVIV